MDLYRLLRRLLGTMVPPLKSNTPPELTADDLKRHSVWKAGVPDDWDWNNHDYLGQILPHTRPGPVDPAEEGEEFVVACEFTGPGGAALSGFLTCDRSEHLALVRPTVVTDRG